MKMAQKAKRLERREKIETIVREREKQKIPQVQMFSQGEDDGSKEVVKDEVRRELKRIQSPQALRMN
jgi:hypothetical protein